MRKLGILSAALAFLVSGAPLWANWGSTAGGSVATGDFHSFGTGQVEMLNENLVIRLYRDHARVQVDYTLHNAGGAVNVRAGFPSLAARLEGQQYAEIADYSISADGQPVPYAIKSGDPTPLKSLFDAKFRDMGEMDDIPPEQHPYALDWYASTVPFSAGQRRHIHIEYDSLYAYCSGGYSDDSDTCDDRFAYVLSTGAAWKGPIVDGKVMIQAVSVDPSRLIMAPNGRFQRDGDKYLWTFHNLKPNAADNIIVSMNNRSTVIAIYGDSGPEGFYVAQSGKYSFLSLGYTVSADSSAEDFPIANVRDNQPDTQWRPAHSPGIGATITLSLKKPAHIDQLGLIPACGMDQQDWFNHARIKSVDVTVNGEYRREAILRDEFFSEWIDSDRGYDWVDLPKYPDDANEIRLTIRDLYPGKNDQVTCITKIILRQWLKSRPAVKGQDGKELP